MGWENRHYNRTGGPGQFGARLQGASVVVWLLGINCVVFVLDGMLENSGRGDRLAPSNWGSFSIASGVHGLQLWRAITYQFLHGDFFHLLFNMIGLYFFGPMMERWWGSRRFVAFYLLCGLGGAVLYTLIYYIPGLIDIMPGDQLVGASACIFGILVGCALLFPHQRVMLLFPPIPMTLRTMAMVFLGIAVLSLMADSKNAGGDAAHLGGAVIGWLLIRRPGTVDFVSGLSTDAFRDAVKQRRNKQAAAEDAEVDRILDKVREKGLASLTSREKKLLQRATDRQKKAG